MAGHRVVFEAPSSPQSGEPALTAEVHREGSDDPILSLNVKELNIGREGAPEAMMPDATASVVSVIALTWAT